MSICALPPPLRLSTLPLSHYITHTIHHLNLPPPTPPTRSDNPEYLERHPTRS